MFEDECQDHGLGLPMFDSKECERMQYIYSQTVDTSMTTTTRNGQNETSHEEKQNTHIQANVNISGHGKTEDGLNMYSLQGVQAATDWIRQRNG